MHTFTYSCMEYSSAGSVRPPRKYASARLVRACWCTGPVCPVDVRTARSRTGQAFVPCNMYVAQYTCLLCNTYKILHRMTDTYQYACFLSVNFASFEGEVVSTLTHTNIPQIDAWFSRSLWQPCLRRCNKWVMDYAEGDIVQCHYTMRINSTSSLKQSVSPIWISHQCVTSLVRPATVNIRVHHTCFPKVGRYKGRWCISTEEESFDLYPGEFKLHHVHGSKDYQRFCVILDEGSCLCAHRDQIFVWHHGRLTWAHTGTDTS